MGIPLANKGWIKALTGAVMLAFASSGAGAQQSTSLGNKGDGFGSGAPNISEELGQVPVEIDAGERAAPAGQRYHGIALLVSQSADCNQFWTVGARGEVRYHAYDANPSSGPNESVSIFFGQYAENIAKYDGTLQSATFVPATFVGIGTSGGWRENAQGRIFALGADQFYARFHLDIWKPNWNCTFQRWRITSVAVN